MPLNLSGSGRVSSSLWSVDSDGDVTVSGGVAATNNVTVGGSALPTNSDLPTLSTLGIANHNNITVDSSGRMTNSNQPAFKGRGPHNGGSGWWTISNGAHTTLTGINAIETNRGNCFDNSTGIFTAPVAGYYVAFLNVYTESTDHLYIVIGVNGNGSVRHIIHYDDHGNKDKGTSHTEYFYLNQNDTLRWQFYGAGGTNQIYRNNTLIGAALIS